VSRAPLRSMEGIIAVRLRMRWRWYAVDFSVLPFLTDSIIGFYLLVDIDGFHICVGIPLCSYHLSLVISTASLNALLRSPSSLQVLLGDINSLYISAPCRI